MKGFDIIFEYLYWIRDFFGKFISENLALLQFASLVLSGLFFAGLIYILTRINYVNLKVEQFMDLFGAGNLSKRRSLKGWMQIQKRLASDDPQQWKIAILEADKILDEILKMAGYLGKMDEKLALITAAQLSGIDEIRAAHKVYNQIIQDPIFALTREEAYRVIDIYRKSFTELNLIRE